MQWSQENAFALFNLSVDYIPTDIGQSRNEIENLIKTHIDQSIDCAYDGNIHVKSDSSKNELVFQYNNCYSNGSTNVDGTIVMALDQFSSEVESDFLVAKNFKITINNQSVVYDYTIKSYINHGLRKWDYYVNTRGDFLDSDLEFNLYVSEDSSKNVTMSGTYLLDSGKYFSLTSKMLKNIDMQWFGFADDVVLSQIVKYRGQQISLIGNKSYVDYVPANGNKCMLVLNTNETRLYGDTERLDWHIAFEDVSSNEYDPILITYIDSKYAPWGTAHRVYDPNLEINIQVYDEDVYSENKISLALIQKPKDSNFELSQEDKKPIINFKDIAGDVYKPINISLDEEGLYRIKITIEESNRTITQELKLEYYVPTLSDNQYFTDMNILDTVHIGETNRVAVLSSYPENTMLIKNINWDTVSQIELPSQPYSIAVSPDKTRLAISSYRKVFIVDISDIDNPSITNAAVIDSDIRDLVMTNDFIYSLEYSDGWASLYSIRIHDGNISSMESVTRGKKVKMLLNSAQNALYILDVSRSPFSPQSIDVYDISIGEATFKHSPPANLDDKFCNDIWLLDNQTMLTGCGVLLEMDDNISNDLIPIGRYNSDMFERHPLGWIETRVESFESNALHEKQITTFGEIALNDEYGATYDNGYANSLEVKSILNNEVLYSSSLKKYVVKNGKEYRLFIEESYLLESSKVMIIYRCVLTGQPSHEVSKDIFMYEIRDI